MHKKQTTKYCHFCVNNISDIDYKNWQQLKRFTSSYGKIVPKRKLAQAIKRARFMALLPYVAK